MLEDNDWINDEKKYFGQPNTPYDFKSNDPKECGRRIQKLKDTKEKMSKTVNMKAMSMLSKAEDQVSSSFHNFFYALVNSVSTYNSKIWSNN